MLGIFRQSLIRDILYTAERVGYVLFFIVNALMWGNLLAGVSSLLSLHALPPSSPISLSECQCTHTIFSCRTRACCDTTRTLVLSRILMRRDAIKSDMTMNRIKMLALSEVGEIHQSASARSQTKMEAVQSTLDFLMENDCPASLRTEIIQVTVT